MKPSASKPPQPRREPAPAPPSPPGARLLVVDDDPSVREMLGRVLEEEGYQVRLAENGEVALRLVTHEPIDLVLLDLNMPIKGGWDTFERLTGRDPLVPVIIITARPNQLFTAAASGVGALLEKPLDFPHLLGTVNRLLKESVDSRLARITGRSARFEYIPSPTPGSGREGGLRIPPSAGSQG